VRAVRRILALSVLGLALLVATAGGAAAHPLGNFTINTYDGIVVVPGEVRVNYVLDMAEIPTFQLGRALDSNGDGTASPAELAAFAHVKSHELRPSVHVAQDGRPVPLAVRSARAILRTGQAGLHILRMEVVYAGQVARTGTLTLRDGTYADHIGWHEITAVGASGAVLSGSNVPTKTISDALLRYPKNLLASPLHVTSARVSFRPGASGAAPTVPNGAIGGLRPGITGGAFARLATWTGLSVPALLLALLLAAGFGAAHALLPGHGKTLIAAYLVGQGGRLRQAAQVGVAVAFMHSASVLALGLAILGLQVIAPDRMYPWVTLATGLLVIGMGSALAAIRIRDARRGSAGHHHRHHNGHDHDHAHAPVRVDARVPVLAGVGAAPMAFAPSVLESADVLVHDHGHAPDGGDGDHADHGHDDHGTHGHDDHSNHCDRPALDRPLSRRGMAGLAVAGGILPSPTAIVVLLATFSAHRVGFGLALILAFSVGMAAALVGVGAVALRARTAVARRLSSRVLWVLPIVTAAVIVGVGAYLTIKGAGGI
jgi:nickel/cobalt transporter (NicO) family protein